MQHSGLLDTLVPAFRAETGIETELFEPCKSPAAVCVEVAFLLGEYLVESLVDQCQRLSDIERLPRGVQDTGKPTVDGHSRADSSLRQINGRH